MSLPFGIDAILGETPPQQQGDALDLTTKTTKDMPAVSPQVQALQLMFNGVRFPIISGRLGIPQSVLKSLITVHDFNMATKYKDEILAELNKGERSIQDIADLLQVPWKSVFLIHSRKHKVKRDKKSWKNKFKRS